MRCPVWEGERWSTFDSFVKDMTEAACRGLEEHFTHKVDRVLGFFSSRPNWDPPPPAPPHPQESVTIPLWFRPPGGGTHLLAGEGVKGPSSDEGTDTVVL
jgi:hypothetical protein